MKKVVLLVTLGGPKTLGEVNDFLFRFTGKELPPHVVRSVIEKYRLIGGGSPLNAITENQAIKLNQMIGEDYLCLPAFRYTKPFIEDALDFAINAEPSKIYFFLMSPFYATVTTGNYINLAKDYLEKLGIATSMQIVHSWYREDKFIECWAKKIEREGGHEDAFYLFSAHSLPLKYSSDPYKSQIEETVELISKRANLKNYALGWQSIPSNATEPWITPTVEEQIDEIVKKGFKRVIQIPVGFTADHIETLYDIDIVHKNYAEKKNLDYKRISSLNAEEDFIIALKNILIKS